MHGKEYKRKVQFKNHFKRQLHCPKVMICNLLIPLNNFIEKHTHTHVVFKPQNNL